MAVMRYSQLLSNPIISGRDFTHMFGSNLGLGNNIGQGYLWILLEHGYTSFTILSYLDLININKRESEDFVKYPEVKFFQSKRTRLEMDQV